MKVYKSDLPPIGEVKIGDIVEIQFTERTEFYLVEREYGTENSKVLRNLNGNAIFRHTSFNNFSEINFESNEKATHYPQTEYKLMLVKR